MNLRVENTLRTLVKSILSEKADDRKGFVGDIEDLTVDNQDFRHVLYTGEHIQLVLMDIPPGEHIGAETHPVDQFFRVESGDAFVFINDVESTATDGDAIVVPAGAYHEIVNAGETPLKLYTLYAPPKHKDGTVRRSREDAERDEEEYDGEPTE